MTRPLPPIGLAMALMAACVRPASPQPIPCDAFYMGLDSIRHVSIERREGALISILDGTRLDGCEVIFQADATDPGVRFIPDFRPEPGSGTAGSGWREIPALAADGAGSSLHVIEQAGVRCAIVQERPAFLDDDGGLVRSDTMTVHVQCFASEGSPGAR